MPKNNDYKTKLYGSIIADSEGSLIAYTDLLGNGLLSFIYS